MPENIEKIYQEIAAYIVHNIHDDWATAWITADITDADVCTLQGRYHKDSDIEEKSFHVDHSIARLFSEIQSLVKREDTDSWSRARFTLRRGGRFELDFTY